jgi:hypothetical protein
MNPWVGPDQMEAHTEGMQRSKVAGLVIALIMLLFGVPALVWANSSGGDDHHRPGVSRMHDADHGHGPPSWAHGGHHFGLDKRPAKARRGLAPMKEECDHALPPGLAKRR